MDASTTCHEIVMFRFKPGTSADEQLRHMEQMSRWLAQQPGFASRHSYHDEESERWVDVVAWRDRASAMSAMARSQTDPALAAIMVSMDPTDMQMGHYTQRVQV